MTDPGLIDAVATPHGDTTTAIGTALTSSGALVTLGWLFIRSKLDSIGLLWKKMDELRDTVASNRLSDAKEYATRAELTRIIEKLEAHFDKRFDDLERKLDTRGNT